MYHDGLPQPQSCLEYLPLFSAHVPGRACNRVAFAIGAAFCSKENRVPAFFIACYTARKQMRNVVERPGMARR